MTKLLYACLAFGLLTACAPVHRGTIMQKNIMSRMKNIFQGISIEAAGMSIITQSASVLNRKTTPLNIKKPWNRKTPSCSQAWTCS